MNTSLNDLPRNPHFAGLQDYQLGMDNYVKGLVRFLQGTVTPMTVALQGEWGSGKTSLMYKLQSELCDVDGATYDGVWINTWEYSLMSESSQALLKIVAKMVSATEPGNINVSRARTVLNHLAKGVAKTALGVGTNDTSIIDAVTDIFTSGGESSIGQLQEELRKNIKSRLSNSGKKGIIFFIDDLDRLNPAVAVELLELLKNIFTIEGCVFILAIDYDVVVKGLRGKFGELTDGNEREFRSFFDKIIQVPFSMPVSNYKPQGFITTALKSIGYISDADAKDERFVDNIMHATKLTVGNNPRSIKRLVNILSLIKCISLTSGSHRHFDLDKRSGKYVNFVVLALQVQYPKVFRMLLHEPNFEQWSSRLLRKMNVESLSDETKEKLRNFTESDEAWEQVLYAVCDSDAYLRGRFLDISNLLNRLREEIDSEIKKEAVGDKNYNGLTLSDVMREAIQVTSVTSFSANDDSPIMVDDQEWIDMVYIFHRGLVENLTSSHPEWALKQRRNTGNGGINITRPDNIIIPFQRQIVDNMPAMQFTVSGGNQVVSQRDLDRASVNSYDAFRRNGLIQRVLEDLDGDMLSLSTKNDWIEWESIVEYHNDPSNFQRNEVVHAPKVTFKFKDIQCFIDSENLSVIANAVAALARFKMAMDEAFHHILS